MTTQKKNMKSWTIENLSTIDINNNPHQNFGILTKEGRIALLGENQEANARLIVKAVNCQDELVSACKSALPLLKHLNKFLKYQSVGKEFYPNRENGDAAINDLEQALANAKGAS